MAHICMTRKRQGLGIPRSVQGLSLAQLLSVGACAYLHKPESIELTPTRTGFEFRAIADAAYPEGTPNGEVWRMRWLQQRLAASGTCPNGCDIVLRKPVRL